MSERTMEGQGRAEQMRAMLAVGGSLSRSIAAMQAAWIEWRRGRGADAAMQWVENTLIGPGLIPGDDESDAQAFFDRAIAEIEEHRRGVEAEIAASEPGEEGGPEPWQTGEHIECRKCGHTFFHSHQCRRCDPESWPPIPAAGEDVREALRAALRPLAAVADVTDRLSEDAVLWLHTEHEREVALTVADARRARAALRSAPTGEGEALTAIRQALQVLEDAPGINPSNYDHDDVVELDVAADEATSILRAVARSSEAQGEERASKYGALLAFADAISDAVWGGERAWEQDGGLERLSQKVRRWAKERAARRGEGGGE